MQFHHVRNAGDAETQRPQPNTAQDFKSPRDSFTAIHLLMEHAPFSGKDILGPHLFQED